jgi:uncharacterized protein (TIGR03000 family)
VVTSPSGGPKGVASKSVTAGPSGPKSDAKGGGPSSGVIQAGFSKKSEGPATAKSALDNAGKGPKFGKSDGSAKSLTDNATKGPKFGKGDNTAKDDGPKGGKGGGKADGGKTATRDSFYGRRGDWDRDDYYRYRNGYYHYHHHHDYFWQYLLYAAIADRFCYGYGFGLWPYTYGFWPYHYGYLYDDVGPYWAQAAPEYVAPAVVASGRATIEVRLPSADAQVWIDGRETSSRGTERTYTSPVLEGGYDYGYSIKASWEQDGELRTVERQITITARDHVVVDFTQSPSRVYRPE